MDHSGREDRKLSEVKAVLRHLQGLPSEPEPSTPTGKTGARSSLRLGGAIGIAVAVVAVVLVVAYAFPRSGDEAKSADAEGTAVAMAGPGSKDEPLTVVPKGSLRPSALGESGSAPDAPAGTPDDVKPALEAAKALLKSGRVRQARERLLALTANGSSDVIWTLARSYDPNSLKEIPDADAPPDVEEAARWYRIWYGMAVKEGLVRDSVSLERIIGSMRK